MLCSVSGVPSDQNMLLKLLFYSGIGVMDTEDATRHCTNVLAGVLSTCAQCILYLTQSNFSQLWGLRD